MSKRKLADDLVRASPNLGEIERILQTIAHAEANDVDLDQVNRGILRRALDRLWREIACEPIVLRLTQSFQNKMSFEWSLPSVPKMIAYRCEHFAIFSQIVAATFAKSPCLPTRKWKIIINTDEYVPGNPLRQSNPRKAWGWAFSILEFGPAVLQHTWGWWPLGTLRSSISKLVRGGFSGANAELLKKLKSELSEPIAVRLNGDAVYLFLEYHTIIADGAALQYFWSWKGGGSMLACWNCANVVQTDDDNELLSHDAAGTIHEISEDDTSKFIACPLAARRQQVLTLARLIDANARDRRSVTLADIQDYSQSIGFSHNPWGVVADRALDGFLQASRYDGMHSIFQHGIVEMEAVRLLEKLNLQGVTMKMIHEYFCLEWCVRKSVGGSKLGGIFNAARQRAWSARKDFGPYASESVVLAPLLTHMLHTHPLVPKHALRHEIASWSALNVVCTLYGRAKVGLGRPADLANAIQCHGTEYKRAYGTSRANFNPKYHWTKHLPDQFEMDGLIIDSFVGERLVQLFKRSSEHIQSSEALEKSGVLRALSAQAATLQTLAPDGLLAGVNGLSKSAMLNGIRFDAGDILFLGPNRPLLIAGFIDGTDGKVDLLGWSLRPTARASPCAGTYMTSTRAERVVTPTSFRYAPLWFHRTDGLVLVFDA